MNLLLGLTLTFLAGTAASAQTKTSGREVAEIAAEEGIELTIDKRASRSQPTAEELLATEMTPGAKADEPSGFSETAEPQPAVKSEPGPSSELKAESEIPVLQHSPKISGKPSDSMTRLLMSLGILAAVIGGIVLFGRYWAKRRFGVAQHHQIKMLTQFSLGPKKSLAIIRVAGESILIGVTDHNISMIKSLALIDEDMPTEIPVQFNESLEAAGFADEVFATAAAQPALPELPPPPREAGEDFSFGSVKDMVASRLREMRSL